MDQMATDRTAMVMARMEMETAEKRFYQEVLFEEADRSRMFSSQSQRNAHQNKEAPEIQ